MRRRYLNTVICLSLISVQTNCGAKPTSILTPTSVEMRATFTATGNEPGWKLDIGNEQIALLMNNGGTRVVAPRPTPEIVGDATRYISTVDGRPLTATIVNRPCADSMSGMPHPKTVVVLFGGQELRGCGGKPAELLQGPEWVVRDINGAGIADGSRGTLNFSSDGVVSGRSFCNTYQGNYTLTGETLSISLTASTLMGCAPLLMNQEKLFLDLLATVRRFEIGPGGALILRTGEERTITARR
jgi:heat shock protein HslJ